MRKFRITSEHTLEAERSSWGSDAKRMTTVVEAYNPLSALRQAVEVTEEHAQRRIVAIEEVLPVEFDLSDAELTELILGHSAIGSVADIRDEAPTGWVLAQLTGALQSAGLVPGLRIIAPDWNWAGARSSLVDPPVVQLQLLSSESRIHRFIEVPSIELPLVSADSHSWESLLATARLLLQEAKELI